MIEISTGSAKLTNVEQREGDSALLKRSQSAFESSGVKSGKKWWKFWSQKRYTN